MKRIYIITVFCICFLGQIMAQNEDGKVKLPESMQFDEIIIDSVEVSGNKLTKDFIITRELDFKIGDTLNTIDSKSKSFGM